MTKMVKKGRVNRLALYTVALFFIAAVLFAFGYHAVVCLLTCMGAVELGDTAFFAELCVMVAIWAGISIFYTYKGRKNENYRPSVAPVVVASIVTFLLIASWILRPQEIEAASEMILYRYNNPLTFIMLNYAGSVCIGIAIGVAIGYCFFSKKIVIYRDDIDQVADPDSLGTPDDLDASDVSNASEDEENSEEVATEKIVVYDKKTEAESEEKSKLS